jgi:hypothetical protein
MLRSGQVLAHHLGIGLAKAALNVGDDAFERVRLEGFALARRSRKHS